MNGKCLDNKGKLKLCPYRTFTETHKAMAVGSGDWVTQQFYQCMGDDCISYHDGYCMKIRDIIDTQAGDV